MFKRKGYDFFLWSIHTRKSSSCRDCSLLSSISDVTFSHSLCLPVPVITLSFKWSPREHLFLFIVILIKNEKMTRNYGQNYTLCSLERSGNRWENVQHQWQMRFDMRCPWKTKEKWIILLFSSSSFSSCLCSCHWVSVRLRFSRFSRVRCCCFNE